MTYSHGSSDAHRSKYWWRPTGTSSWTQSELVLQNQWEMISQSNARDKRGTFIDGGPFYLKTEKYNVIPAWMACNGNGDTMSYPSGLFTGYVISSGFTGVSMPTYKSALSDATLIGKGATAISRVIPTAPDFSLATQIGELKEKFPTIIGSSLMRDQVKTARSAGSEYLNVEFGWKPLVKSVQDFARAVKNGNSQIMSYSKEARRHTRRRYSFPTVMDPVKYDSDQGGTLRPAQVPFHSRGSYWEQSTQDTWFSGAWVFYVPVGDDLRSRILRTNSEANKLLGTRLTPSVLWELAPWSWAVDWFTNVGDVFTNISAIGVDGLVMKYGYIMHHNRTFREQRHTRTSKPFLTTYRDATFDTKLRMEASPYGFGVNWDGMTPRQIAIATALGLARS